MVGGTVLAVLASCSSSDDDRGADAPTTTQMSSTPASTAAATTAPTTTTAPPPTHQWQFHLTDSRGWEYEVTVSASLSARFESDVSTSPPGRARLKITLIDSPGVDLAAVGALADRTAPDLVLIEAQALFEMPTPIDGLLGQDMRLGCGTKFSHPSFFACQIAPTGEIFGLDGPVSVDASREQAEDATAAAAATFGDAEADAFELFLLPADATVGCYVSLYVADQTVEARADSSCTVEP